MQHNFFLLFSMFKKVDGLILTLMQKKTKINVFPHVIPTFDAVDFCHGTQKEKLSSNPCCSKFKK